MSEWRNLLSCIRGGRGRGRVIATRDYVLALDEFERASSLGRDLMRLRGRSVVLSVQDMAKAAAALIELDGFARRVVLCPAGWEPWRLELAARDAEADAYVYDPDAAAAPVSVQLSAPCRLPLQALDTPRVAAIWKQNGSFQPLAQPDHQSSWRTPCVR